MTRWHPHGSHPNEPGALHEPFNPALRLGQIPGMFGLAKPDLFTFEPTSVGELGGTDRQCWGLGNLSPHCVFDWADGDGLAPRKGNALTATGTPTAGRATPWLDCNGNATTATEFAANELLASATAVDPTSGHDIVVVSLFRRESITAGNKRFFGTMTTGNGWVLYHDPGSNVLQFRCRSAALDRFTNVAVNQLGWVFAVGVMDASGNQVVYANGVAGTPAASPSGSMASTVGIGLGGAPSGILSGDVGVARCMAFYGSGIADIATQAWVDHLTATVFGYFNRGAGGNMSFAGAGMRSYTECHTGGVHLLSANGCPSGNVGGMEALDGGTNKCYQNVGYETGDEALFTQSAGMTNTTVDDSAALITNDCREVGARVIRMASPGLARLLRYGATTANTNKHWVSVRAKVISGTPEIGVWDGTTFTKAGDLTQTDYTVKYYAVTPANANQQWALNLPAGAELYFVFPQMTESAVPVDEIPNIANAAAATLAEATLSFPATLDQPNTAGTWQVVLNPHGWATGDLGAAQRIIQRLTVNTDVLSIDDSVSPAKVKSGDGTNTASATIVEVDETGQTIMASWGDDGLITQQTGQARNVASYDGSLNGSGRLRIKGTGYRSVKLVKLHVIQHQNTGQL